MSDLKRGILIVDFGSQTTLLIARRLREMGVYCEIAGCHDTRLMTPPECLGIILSGGPASVGAAEAPRLGHALIDSERPVLGICYGMQLIVEHFGGRVERGEHGEYGRTAIYPEERDSVLLTHFPAEGSVAWMSHFDRATSHPAPIHITARTEAGVVAAIEVEGHPVYGVQFHPEVTHTERGEALLRAFAFEVCGAAGDWEPGSWIAEKVAEIREAVGEARVVCGLSGGVDSSVAAALIARAIGEQLVCVLVDTGLMREGEIEQVTAHFRDHSEVELRVIDARELFLTALAEITDPEAKRKAIGRVFIEVFEAAVSDLEGVGFLAQGTLYPDVIESTNVRGPSAKIKSHHNVGGLPERLPFALLEPLRDLFKDEVRALGRELKLPKRIVGRHPFPGPGLAIRILGAVDEERLTIVRAADHIFTEGLREFELYDKTWQAFAVLLPVKTVGVMGDARTYESVVALRAVNSVDGMTADRSALPMDFLSTMADRIINRVRGVNRVVYDITSKPPGTIEWE